MIVTTPIFRELKQAYPNISISVLASQINKDVIRNNPYIDEIYTDCDNDTVLLKVRNRGTVCHTGKRACFYKKFHDKSFEEDFARI